MLEKVTIFITRSQNTELLLLEHPYAGIQIPAGTVEPGEAPEAAAMREAAEETGLIAFESCKLFDVEDENLSDDHPVLMKSTKVYARPDTSSFDWASLPRGAWVRRLRQEGRFSQVIYEEWDRYPDPQFLSMSILGWVPDHTLTTLRRRYIYQLEFSGASVDEWTLFMDNHHFRLFWSPIDNLPAIVAPHDRWLKFLTDHI